MRGWSGCPRCQGSGEYLEHADAHRSEGMAPCFYTEEEHQKRLKRLQKSDPPWSYKPNPPPDPNPRSARYIITTVRQERSPVATAGMTVTTVTYRKVILIGGAGHPGPDEIIATSTNKTPVSLDSSDDEYEIIIRRTPK